MAKYRKRPIVIEAMRVPELDEALSWGKFAMWMVTHIGDRHWEVEPDGKGVSVETLEGIMLGSIGDYIICGVEGELYPCKPDIFAKTYEAVQ